jgi:hypothetical protein
MMLAAVASLSWVSASHANSILVNFVNATADITSGYYDFNYSISLAGTSGAVSDLKTNDFFTIVDFAGMDATAIARTSAILAAAHSDWSFTTPLVAVLPPPAGITESNTAANAQFNYNAATTLSSDLGLGVFTVVTNVKGGLLHGYAAADHNHATGAAEANEGTVIAADSNGPDTVTPVPSSFYAGLGLFGLLGTGLASRKLRVVPSL